jgi:hypothetical protein
MADGLSRRSASTINDVRKLIDDKNFGEDVADAVGTILGLVLAPSAGPPASQDQLAAGAWQGGTGQFTLGLVLPAQRGRRQGPSRARRTAPGLASC